MAGIVAHNAPSVAPELREDLVHVLDTLAAGQKVVQPRVRHRFQTDRVGLTLSAQRLVADDGGLDFDFEDELGRPVQLALGAIYAAGSLPVESRTPVFEAIKNSLVWGSSGRQPFHLICHGWSHGRSRRSAGLERSRCLGASRFLGIEDDHSRWSEQAGRPAQVPGPASRRPPRSRRRLEPRRSPDRRADRGSPDPFGRLISVTTQTSQAEGLLLFHGAGGDRDHQTFLALETALDIPVGRVNFPYRQKGPGRRPPDRMPKLIAAIQEAVAEYAAAWGTSDERVVLGGRSMGGRAASMAYAEGTPAAGLALLSYPLHPPGKPDKLRVDHFGALDCPVLLVQGTRDPFGKPVEFAEHLGKIPGPVTELWIDANHDPKKHDDQIVEAMSLWLAGLGNPG